jgi:hypothetical protein
MQAILQPLENFFAWLEETAGAVFIRESDWAFPALESAHVIALALVVGTIAIVDLRLLGLASTRRPVTELCREVLPWTWLAFVVAVIAGMGMFVTQPLNYYGNTAFRFKLLFLVFAAINMAVFQMLTYPGVARWDRDAQLPLRAKLAGGISLMCWLLIVFLGRQIGFTLVPG